MTGFNPDELSTSEEVTEHLKSIAETGNVEIEWSDLQRALVLRLNSMLEAYQEKSPDNKKEGEEPNVEKFDLDASRNEIIELIESFSEPPFTIQRVCELLYSPFKYYDRISTFLRGLEKNLRVISSNIWPKSIDISINNISCNSGGSNINIINCSGSSNNNNSSSSINNNNNNNESNNNDINAAGKTITDQEDTESTDELLEAEESATTSDEMKDEPDTNPSNVEPSEPSSEANETEQSSIPTCTVEPKKCDEIDQQSTDSPEEVNDEERQEVT